MIQFKPMSTDSFPTSLSQSIDHFLGMIWCNLRKYALYNYDYNFVANRINIGRYQNSLALINKIRTHKLLKTIKAADIKELLTNLPALIYLYLIIKTNTASINYLSSKYYYDLPEDKRKQFLIGHYWANTPGAAWHQALEEVYSKRREFVRIRYPLIKCITNFRQQKLDGVIEIGSGNGWFLNLLSHKIKSSLPLIGLDINRQTVNRARQRYKTNPKLDFICGDLNTYIKNRSVSLVNKLIITCNVLEYFSTAELTAIAQLLIRYQPCYLAIFERVSFPHAAAISYPIKTFSFSHNYVKFFEKFGLDAMYIHKETAKNAPNFFNLTALFQVPARKTRSRS